MKLKTLSLADCEQVRLWRNQQSSMLRTPFLLTQEQQEMFYRDVICNRQANARFWGVEATVTEEAWTGDLDGKTVPVEHQHFVGMTGLENISWENRLAEISLIFNPKYSMDKYGEEALRLLLYEGFMNMNLENIYTEVYSCNPNLDFWASIINKYKCIVAFLPFRKYHNGEYYSSTYLNINKGAFTEHENSITESTQALN